MSIIRIPLAKPIYLNLVIKILFRKLLSVGWGWIINLDRLTWSIQMRDLFLNLKHVTERESLRRISACEKNSTENLELFA